MSSSGKPTSNLGLNQWFPNDKPERADFDSDNLKIDAAFNAIKQDVSAIEGGTTTVGKAVTAQQTARLKGISTVGGCGLVNIGNPIDGIYYTNAQSVTGAIKIKMPIDLPASFVSFWVDIFDYSGGSFSAFIAGYAQGTNLWSAGTAFIVSNNGNNNMPIRLAYDLNTPCVCIGDVSRVWRYPQVTIRDFQAGWIAHTPDDWLTGWGITLVTVLPTTINATINNVYLIANNVIPGTDNAYDIGTANLRMRNIYAGTGTINTSDSNDKKDIIPLNGEKATNFIMSQNPVEYTFIGGLRTHWGLISQKVEQAVYANGMNSLDFAGYCISPITDNIDTREVDEDGNPIIQTVITGEKYGLRYEEFIAPMMKMLQVQHNEIKELKLKIKILAEE